MSAERIQCGQAMHTIAESRITIPPTFPGPVLVGVDLASTTDAAFGVWNMGMRALMQVDNPVPEANRCAGMIIPDPAIADKVEAYAKARGGKISTFFGFKFITLSDPERVLWKLKLIGRLEHQRRRIEAATDGLALAEARRRF